MADLPEGLLYAPLSWKTWPEQCSLSPNSTSSGSCLAAAKPALLAFDPWMRGQACCTESAGKASWLRLLSLGNPEVSAGPPADGKFMAASSAVHSHRPRATAWPRESPPCLGRGVCETLGLGAGGVVTGAVI